MDVLWMARVMSRHSTSALPRCTNYDTSSVHEARVGWMITYVL